MIAAVIFGLIALLHIYRITPISKSSWARTPLLESVSWVALLVTAALSVMLFGESALALERLNVELEVEDVAVLDDIFLAFLP